MLGGDFNCVLKACDIEGGVGFAQKNCLGFERSGTGGGFCGYFSSQVSKKA